jgi:RimJ/RimL family protein N-acetyltransferase
VTLRPLSPADHDQLFAVAADPLIWEQHPDKTRCEPAGFDAFFQQALDSGGGLLATETATGRVIGSSRFHGYDEAAGEVEIGWTFLARSHWGGQYNRDMKRLMLEHALRHVERVIFVIDPANHRSQRAVQKLGAVRATDRVDASGRTCRVFQIAAREWRVEPTFRVREATIADISLLARHRGAMFRDMGRVGPDGEAELVRATADYFRDALPRGEYLGWVAHSTASPPEPVGGAGVQLRPILPRPGSADDGIELGPEAIVLNVYVEPAWRRRGVGEALMRSVLSALAERKIRRIVLHASDEGRRLYERLGFVPTNEMRLETPRT